MSDLLLPDTGYDYVCQRCLHQWRTRVPNAPRPRCCAKCRSAYYDLPPREPVSKPVKVESKKRRNKPVSRKPRPALARGLDTINTEAMKQVDHAPVLERIFGPVAEPHPLLEPPPHLRARHDAVPAPFQSYYEPVVELAPENAIRKPVSADHEELVTVESNAGTESTDAEA